MSLAVEVPVAMRPTLLCPCLVLVLAALSSGCAGLSSSRYAATPRPDAPPPQAVVFVIDGVGNFGATSASLGQAIEEAGLPLHLHTVEWSHGYGRIFADHVDHCHARHEGRKLAEQIACYQRPRADGPPLPIYMIAHRGGTCVAPVATAFLAAAPPAR